MSSLNYKVWSMTGSKEAPRGPLTCLLKEKKWCQEFYRCKMKLPPSISLELRLLTAKLLFILIPDVLCLLILFLVFPKGSFPLCNLNRFPFMVILFSFQFSHKTLPQGKSGGKDVYTWKGRLVEQKQKSET